MTLSEGIELSQKARAKGYVTRVQHGRVQFVVGEYDTKGSFRVARQVTGWLKYKAALRRLEAV